jgi:hypothetical protein
MSEAINGELLGRKAARFRIVWAISLFCRFAARFASQHDEIVILKESRKPQGEPRPPAPDEIIHKNNMNIIVYYLGYFHGSIAEKLETFTIINIFWKSWCHRTSY